MCAATASPDMCCSVRQVWPFCAAQGTFHVWWAVHVLEKANTNVVVDGVTYLKPFVAPWGEKGSPKDALWHGLALQFEPFAAKLFRTHVLIERQRVPCADGCTGSSGCFSYIGASVHADGVTGKGVHSLLGVPHYSQDT